ncbi:MAG TPA: rod shape-determining protein MreC [Candidatus Merdivicinus excrementipullorum]|uniref:Cell shape-determining protein MreC n=1 Tax=Candidatus Merdivicinus excrementipullorum TaxID=2840867 RepID=A0A9D1FLP7_9FIRM|nr:rod shape-determining protein MreC [Candidatus Merdivicinus excrementipullorum]
MREFFKSLRFKIILAVVAVILGGMLYAATTGGLATLPEQILSYVVYPVQRAAAAVSDSITGFFSVFVDAQENYEENQRLKEENAELRRQLVDYEDTKTENERLKEITGLKELNPDIEFQPAGVIARDPEDRFGAFTIDIGYLHGISVRDPVVTGEGLVGYISKVGPTYAVVTTILSPDCNVGAMEISTKDTGNITGTVELAAEGCTKLELLPRDTLVEEGGTVVTAGTSGLFPKNLVIGTVEKVELETSGITSYAVIRPVSEINEIKNVFVLTDFLGKGSSDAEGGESSDAGA